MVVGLGGGFEDGLAVLNDAVKGEEEIDRGRGRCRQCRSGFNLCAPLICEKRGSQRGFACGRVTSPAPRDMVVECTRVGRGERRLVRLSRRRDDCKL